MNKSTAFGQDYFHYRRQVYASVNGRIGSLTKLRESRLLKPDERELVVKTIFLLQELRNKINKTGYY